MADELPIHWRFALDQALYALHGLGDEFDFRSSAGQHAYAGVDPRLLLRVVDGFLDDETDHLYPADIRTLKTLRALLEEDAIPAFESGVRKAKELSDGEPDYDAEEIKDRAEELAPDARARAGWFMEGFCAEWSERARPATDEETETR